MKIFLVTVLVAFVCATTVFGAPLENANKESPADLYAQYINIIGEVSKLNGLENIWLQYEEPLQQQVNEWKNQYNLDASSELQWQEATTTLQLINEYLRVAENTCSDIISKIENQVFKDVVGFEKVEREMEKVILHRIDELLQGLNNCKHNKMN